MKQFPRELAAICRSLPLDQLTAATRADSQWRDRFEGAARRLHTAATDEWGSAVDTPKSVLGLISDLHGCGQVPEPRHRAGELFTKRAVASRLHMLLAEVVLIAAKNKPMPMRATKAA